MKDSLRIGIDLCRYYRKNRGISVYTSYVLNSLLNENKHQFYLFHYPNLAPIDIPNKPNIKTIELVYPDNDKPMMKIIEEQVIYPIIHKKYKLDVFFHPQNHGLYSKQSGYVVTMHDILPLTQPEFAKILGLESAEKKKLSNERIMSIQNADCIITVSEFSKKEIINNIKVDPNKVKVIYEGVDKNKFYRKKLKSITAKKYNLPKKYILTIGAYSDHKNLYFLVDAFKKSNVFLAGYELVLAGPSNNEVFKSNKENLINYIDSLGMNDYIKTLGTIDDNDLAEVYSGAEIFTICSKYEGFGFPPLEAMACGTPVLASYSTAIPEICGEAALYANPNSVEDYANKINLLIKNKKLQNELTKKGFINIEKYNWNDCAEKTIEILELIGRSNIS